MEAVVQLTGAPFLGREQDPDDRLVHVCEIWTWHNTEETEKYTRTVDGL